jgi:thiamine pyrophosphokinase
MSSHHIVRDTQEPALIIANGEACSLDLLNQLLEWNPIVMVLDGALQRVLELGIKIDIVLGDFDREHHPENYLAHQNPVEIIHTPDQNKTDLEKGIDLLLSRNHKAINVIWATGRRADHTINNITNLVRYQDKATLVIYDDYSKIYCLPKKFDKWYTKGTPISLIPVGIVSGITTTGLKYNLVQDELTIGYKSGSSNEAAEDGTISIAYEQGNLLMMECWDNA